MRITAVHSAYASTSVSGENLAAESQTQALKDAGHVIDLFERRTDDLATRAAYPLMASAQVASGRDMTGRATPAPEGRDHVLLVHNLFPNFGTRWIADWPGPVVTMLHNYRYVCANGLLLRDGEVCTDCVAGSNLPALRYGCYRDSRLATLPIAIGNRRPTRRLPQLARAAAVIAQTERAMSVFSQAGVDEASLRLVPGFTDVPVVRPVGPRERWVFVGRISEEKGLRELLAIWPEGEHLDVIGEGPQRAELEASAPTVVRFLGALPHDEVVSSLAGYQGLVFPGVCWEGAHPMVVREALAQGTPVLAATGSSAADLVARAGGGVEYLQNSAESLRAGLRALRSNADELGRAAHQVAVEAFSRDRWQAEMSAILEQVVAQHLRTRT